MAVVTNFNPVNDIILAIVFVGGVIVYAKTRIPAQAFKNLKTTVESYEERIKAQDITIEGLKEARVEDVKTIGILQGQIDSYKELPLRELADGIQAVVKISRDNAISNQKILEVLTRQSEINAEDRDVLTNQSLHIKTEVQKEMRK